MNLGLILLLAFSAQIVLAGSWLLWADYSARRRRVTERLRPITPQPTSLAAPTISREAESESNGLLRFAGLFGFDWNRRSSYPLKWWLVLTATCVAGLAAYLGTRGILGSLAVLAWPAGWIFGSRALFKGWERKRCDELLSQLSDALSMVVRTVSVGVPMVEAVRLIARESPEPTAGEFRQLAEEISIGLPLDEAVLAMAERTGMTEYRFFATTIMLQMQTGGGLSEALTNLAEVVRRRVAMRDRGYALSSEARTSAKVLMALPFVVGLAMLLLSPGYMDPLLYTDTGHHLLEAAAVSLVVGSLVMRAMIRSALA